MVLEFIYRESMMIASVNTASILLADEDGVSRPLLRQALQDVGHTVFSAKTDRALWSALAKDRIDLIILDAELGDGYAVCTRLKMLASQIPVMMIVPPTEEAIARARASGAEECLVRPIQPSLLLWRIHDLLNHRETIRRQLEARLFDSVNDAIFLVDLQYDYILEVNRHASKLLGYTRGEFLAMRYSDVVGEVGYKVDGVFVQELTTKGHFLYEHAYRSKTGRAIIVEVSSRVIDYNGKKAILSFARDIRKRKQAEAVAAEQRHLAEALRDTAAALNSTLNLTEVVERVLEQVNRVVPSDAASIMLLQGVYARVAGRRGYEWYSDNSSRLNEGRNISELGTIQWMIKNRQALLIEETHSSDYWKQLPDTTWIHAYLGAPIINDDQLIGFINLDSKTPHYFTRGQIDYLTAFANQASIAIRNAQLYETAQRHADELEGHVAHRTQELIDVNLQLKEQIVERQRIETELNSERNLLRTLMDALPDHIYAKDRESRFLLGNVSGAVHFGLGTVNDLLGKTDLDLYPKEIAAEFYDEEQNIMRTGQPITREISPLDEQKWFLMTKIPLRDNSGTIVGLVGINRDITELKEAEARIQHVISGANCLLGYAIAEQKPDKQFAWDFFVTSEATAMAFLPMDLQPAETYRDAFWRCIQKEDQRRILHRFKDAMQNDERVFTMEFMCRRADGQMRWLNIDVQNKPLTPGRWTLVSVTTDITARKALEVAMQEANQTLEKRVQDRTVELSQANAALRESEARFRVLVEHAPEAIVVFDAKTERFVDVNENAVRLFGLPKKKLLQQGPLQFSPPQQPDGTASIVAGRRWIERAIKGEIPVYEWVHRSANGRNIVCEVRLVLLPTSGGLLVRGSITDITERKKAEQAEREQRMLAEALGDAAAALSSSLDLNNVLDRILHYMARVMPQHELSAVMLIEDDLYVRVVRQKEYGDYTPTTLSPDERFYLDSVPELRLIFDTDRPIAITDTQDAPNLTQWISSREVHSYVGAPIHAEGRVVGFIYLGSSKSGQFTDDHARWLLAFTNQAGIAIQNARLYESIRQNAIDLRQRVAERTAELEHERSQLRATLDAMTEGVIYHDRYGQPIYINESLFNLMGYTTQEWWTDSIRFMGVDKTHQEMEQVFQVIAEHVIQYGIWRGEMKVQPKDGESFDASIVTTLVKGVDGQPDKGAVTVMRDISQEKRLESQKSRFIATASHELRTPLTNIKTRLYLLSKQPERLAGHLEILESVTDRMRKLVEDLLDVSRFEHGTILLKRKPSVLQELIEKEIHVQQPEAQKKGINLMARWPNTPLIVSIDVSRMNQVITNLLTNAINYTPSGGKIEVWLEVNQAKGVFIHIQDTGIGIPDDLLPTVFQPFVRGSDYEGGTGLGLSITREIVELHDGMISVTSELGVGTRFSVWLALLDEAATD